jgi:hypothetical protein
MPHSALLTLPCSIIIECVQGCRYPETPILVQAQLLYFPEIAVSSGNPTANIATGVLKLWTLKFGLFGGLKFMLEEYYVL